MAKTKKRQPPNDSQASLVFEGDDFPNAITVELWRRKPKGKRVLVGSRRYEILAATDGVAPSLESAEPDVVAAPAAPKAPAKRRAPRRRSKVPPAGA